MNSKIEKKAVRAIRVGALALIAVGVSGCASMMGFGESEYRCPGMPAGVVCMKPSNVYKLTETADVVVGDHPGNGSALAAGAAGKGLSSPPGRLVAGAITGPLPVLEPAQVMRVWIAPWIDKSGDLNYPSFVFTEVKKRRWSFGENVGKQATVLTPLQVNLGPSAEDVAKAQSDAEQYPQPATFPAQGVKKGAAKTSG